MRKIRALAALAVAWAVPAPLLANDLPSQWRPSGITSAPLSWTGVPFERDAGLDVGAVNNTDYLWVCLYPSNHRVEHQLILGGVTVWVLDEDGDRMGGVRLRPQTPPGEAPIAPSESGNWPLVSSWPLAKDTKVALRLWLFHPTAKRWPAPAMIRRSNYGIDQISRRIGR